MPGMWLAGPPKWRSAVSAKPVLLDVDASAVRARRVLEQMLGAEAAASE